MKLLSFHVRDFRCVRDSNEVEVGDVTCLVGKNESGKTALLQALYRLNPVDAGDGKFSVTDDYPRANVSDYEQAMEEEEREHAVPIEAIFELSEDELATIESDFGKGILPKKTFRLSKPYDGNQARTVSFTVQETVAVESMIANADVGDELASALSSAKSVETLREQLQSHSRERTQAVEKATVAAESIEDPTEKAKAKQNAAALGESAAARELRELTEEIEKSGGLMLYIWNEYIKPDLPLFLYFDEYYQMTGEVNIEQLQERDKDQNQLDSDKPMKGLLEMARLDVHKILNTDRTEDLINKLEGASNRLTTQIFKYWSQNTHLRVTFDVRPAKPSDPPGMQQGTNLWGRVHDSLHAVTTRLGSRSKGFVWFFSFLAWFSKQKKQKQPLILLLDEPGLFLHAKAQGDLLRYIEIELKPHHQVVYTTHSPFMVDANHFDRVRIVEDRSTTRDVDLDDTDKGTKVFTEVLEADDASLFPLQGALGYDIAQSLFVGANCLIVEGVSDLLFIQVMSSILEQDGREGLNSNWTITPVGGSDKVSTFVALLGSQKKLNVATLIDRANKDAQKIEQLYKSRLLSKKNVLTYADFTGTQEADVEDMFELAPYLALVNGEFQSALQKNITQAAVKSKKPRMVQRFEDYFDSNPLQGNERYNHYRPARFLAENSTTLAKTLRKSEKTLDRFESAFKRLNSLLPQA